MRYLLTGLLILLLVKCYDAQETGVNWPIVEQCVGEPTEPPVNWSFEGFIAYFGGDGVHAIRSNLTTPYFLAFAGPSQFVQWSSFSPNGQWLKVPAGRQGWYNWVENWYHVDEYRIYSTGLDRELVYRIPWDYGFTSTGAYYGSYDWAGNDYFVEPWGNTYNSEAARYDLNTQEYQTIPIPPIAESTSKSETSTNQLVFIGTNEEGTTEPIEVFGLENGHLTLLSNELPYHSYTNVELEIHYLDGSTATIMSSDVFQINSSHDISPDGRYLVFSAGEISSAGVGDMSLYILDTDSQTIFNTCISRSDKSFGNIYPVAWSPDGTMLAFSSSRIDSNIITSRLVILDLESYQLYSTQYFLGQVMGWYQGY